jgi:hypothetical protein
VSAAVEGALFNCCMKNCSSLFDLLEGKRGPCREPAVLFAEVVRLCLTPCCRLNEKTPEGSPKLSILDADGFSADLS